MNLILRRIFVSMKLSLEPNLDFTGGSCHFVMLSGISSRYFCDSYPCDRDTVVIVV